MVAVVKVVARVIIAGVEGLAVTSVSRLHKDLSFRNKCTA